MRPAVARFVVVAGLLGGVVGLFVAPGPASASCAGPQITVEPSSGETGSAITVKGKYFGKGCNDTPTPGQPQPTPPDTGIKLYFDQGAKSWLIGTGDAQQDLTFEAHVFVPDGDGVNESPYGQTPKAGAATVRAKGSNGEPTAPFEVTKVTKPETSTTSSSSTTVKSSTTLPDEGDLAATTTTASDDEGADGYTTTTEDTPETTEVTIALEDLTDDPDGDGARTSPFTAVALVLVSAVAATTLVSARRY